MTDPAGYAYVGRRKPPGEPWQSGDIADMYPLLDQVDEFTDPDPAGYAVDVDAEHYAAQWRAASARRDEMRKLKTCGCDCSTTGRRSPLVTLYADADGIKWVWIRGIRLPVDAKDTDHPEDESEQFFAASSVNRAGLPRVWPATCRVCSRYWIVSVTSRGFRLIRSGTPRFGVTVR